MPPAYSFVLKYSLTPDLSLEDYLGDLPKADLQEALAFSRLLRRKPLSALQQFGNLQDAFATATISEQGRGDLHVYLMVLSHHAHSESINPLHARTLHPANIAFWDACVETEVPRLLMEFLANDDALSLDHYTLKYGASPSWGFAILALLSVTRVWGHLCQADGPPLRVMKPMTEGLLCSVMRAWVPMWRNLWKHKKVLFSPLFCKNTYAGHIMEIAVSYYSIKYMLTGEYLSMEESVEMLHTLFWAWTHALPQPSDRENCPIHLAYAVLPAREENNPRYAVIARSLLADVGQDALLSKMATLIADSPTLYGGELENSIDVFASLVMDAGREALDRLPLLHVLQRALVRYRLNEGRPSYGFAGDQGHDSRGYRKMHLLLEGFNLLSCVLIGLYEGTRLFETTLASDMMDTLLSLMLITKDIMKSYDEYIDNQDFAHGILNYFIRWTHCCSPPKGKRSSAKSRRQLRLPRSFMRDMRRAAMDQARWYIVLRALCSAPVKPRCALLQVRLIDSWKDFGRTLDLSSEDAMQAAMYARQLYFCHDPQCLYNISTPPNALKKCLGCSEAYYCTKECQRRDWREGDHKYQCGRRLGV